VKGDCSLKFYFEVEDRIEEYIFFWKDSQFQIYCYEIQRQMLYLQQTTYQVKYYKNKSQQNFF
jgi:hypothetical protein